MDHGARVQALTPRRVAIGLLAVSALATSSASAQPFAPEAKPKPRVIKLNWVEQRGADFFSIPMTFKVTDVTIAARAWSVRASFTNRSQKTVRISRKSTSASARYSFGLGAPTVTSQPGVVYTQLEQFDATYAKPRFPMQLRPGRSWTGVFGGPGVPPKRKLVNVTFGIFSAAGEVKDWSWVTDHAFKL